MKDHPSKCSDEPWKRLANEVASALDADVLLVNSELTRSAANKVIKLIASKRSRPNVVMLLVTPGGSADAAYRLARYLQDAYERVIAFVSGYCKSAGTLCVMGAHEIIISDFGELGPLDVQFYKKDELGDMSSGLIAEEALRVLQKHAFSMFEQYFIEIKEKSAGLVTFRTATEISTNVVVELFEPMYRQIDPMNMGEIARSMTVARDYGRRLLVEGENFSEEALDLLVRDYPSHGFVIDRREACQLFKSVREPTQIEEDLAKALGANSRDPVDPGSPSIVAFLSDSAVASGLEAESKEEAGHVEKDHRAGATAAQEGGDGRDPSSPANADSSTPDKPSEPRVALVASNSD